MFEKIFAITILVVCIALMARLLAGPRRRLAIDAWARRMGHRARSTWLSLYHWRTSHKTAKQVADEAIRRAREDKGSWEGNVYKPKSFKRPPRDKMH